MKTYAYLALALLILAGVTTVSVYMHRCAAAQNELRSLLDQSKRELKDAQDRIKTDADEHARALAAQKETHDAETKAANLEHAADLDRVRQLDAARAERAALAGAPAGPGAGAGCSDYTRETEQRLRSLEQVASGLADANRDALIAIDTLAGERDSLVGK